MLEFTKNRYGILNANAGTLAFQINKTNMQTVTQPYWVVIVRKTKKSAERLDSSTHRRFETPEAAMEFCEDVATGKVTFDDLRAQFEAETAARERRAINRAVERAKEFRTELEAVGLTYTQLLNLMDKQMNLDEMAHRYLLGYDRGEGWPNG